MPRLVLERHAFAPELNRAHVLAPSGRVAAVLPCPGCQSIKAARAALFRPVLPGVRATVAFTRPAPWAGLNRTYSGQVFRRADALAWARYLAAERHAGGELSDGSTLPAASYRVAFTFN